MKAAKIASQIKRFVHLFGGHVSENTQAFFFRQTLTEFSETQSESGRKGAKVRWEGHVKEMATPSKINGDPIGQPIIPPLANGMAENGSPVSVSSLQTPLKTPLPPLGKGESVQPSMPEGFEKFWAAYPKKEGKLAAVKAWGKIPSPVATLPRMLEAIASQKKTESWTKDGGQFIPHPATWLNAGRWMDALTVEVAPKAVGGNF